MSWCVFVLLLHVSFASVIIQGPLLHDQLGNKERKKWGLLVAGSMGYDNYRHQADVCHAYQVLHQHGIPDERIVVMMYEDIANNTENPTRGEIVNRPNGTNVYKGVPKDYTGDAVTPHNFLQVLQGGKPENGSGKVIKSGKDDHVFVYFSDHGAPGMLIFPNSHLHARRLIEVIMKMHKEGKYGEMVFFVEACYSGSMFETLLPKNISVYAMTAAHPHELSYACYYDEFRSVWLGDRFSVNWMEYVDQNEIHKETLGHLYKIVKNETTPSHVMEYGDMKTTRHYLSEFIGGKNVRPVVLTKYSCGSLNGADTIMGALEYKINKTTNESLKNTFKEQRNEILKKREELGTLFLNVVGNLSANHTAISTKPASINLGSYERAADAFSESCLKLSKNPFASGFLFTLANLCNWNYTAQTIINTLYSTCANLKLNNVI